VTITKHIAIFSRFTNVLQISPPISRHQSADVGCELHGSDTKKGPPTHIAACEVMGRLILRDRLADLFFEFSGIVTLLVGVDNHNLTIMACWVRMVRRNRQSVRATRQCLRCDLAWCWHMNLRAILYGNNFWHPAISYGFSHRRIQREIWIRPD